MPKDASRSPFDRRNKIKKTYFGPFKVIYKADKYFTLLQNGVLNNVPINRLKTADLPLYHTDESLQSSTCEATKFIENANLSFDDSSSLNHLNSLTWNQFSEAVEWGVSSDLMPLLIYDLY